MDRFAKILCLLLLGAAIPVLTGCASTADDTWLPETPATSPSDNHGWGPPTAGNPN